MTSCKYCSATFEDGVEIIGQPGARLEKLVQTLGAHLDAKHKDVEQIIGADVQAFAALLFLMSFKTTDPKLTARRDELRWRVHQLTLNARFSDESLKEQCVVLSRKLHGLLVYTISERSPLVEEIPEAPRLAAICDMLLEVFTGMRNDLEEPNRYPVVQPAVVV